MQRYQDFYDLHTCPLCVHSLLQAKRYDTCMQRYQDGAIKTSQTLAFLNLGQSWIFTGAMTIAMLTTANVGVWVGISNCGCMCGGTSKCIIVLYLTVAMLSTANVGVWVGISRCGCMRGGTSKCGMFFAYDGCKAHHCKCGCVGFEGWKFCAFLETEVFLFVCACVCVCICVCVCVVCVCVCAAQSCSVCWPRKPGF